MVSSLCHPFLHSLRTYQDIGLAADALSENTVKEEAKHENVHQILNTLNLSMKPYMCVQKSYRLTERILSSTFFSFTRVFILIQ